MRAVRCLIAVGLCVVVGCGSPVTRRGPGAPGAETKQAKNEVAFAAPGFQGVEELEGAVQKRPQEQPRKIIHSAKVKVIVDGFEPAAETLHRLIREREGAYIAKSDITGTPGSPRYGTWTVRVPVARFEDFLAAVTKLGETVENSTDSEDVTDQYYDVQEHIKNDKVREEGLRKLYLETAAKGTTKDRLEVDRELSGVRTKIDVQKGQIQRWDKLTQLATAVVTLQDRRDYVPPVVPNFSTSLGRTFQGSVEALVSFGKFIVLAVVAVTPWLLVVGVLATPLLVTARRRRRRRAAVLELEPAPTPPPRRRREEPPENE